MTATPEVRYAQGNSTAVAKFSLAVSRRFKRDGEPEADFINCVAFGKNAEFIEKYFKKGMLVAICGRIQTGSYLNRDGKKVYTTDIVVEEQDFCEKRKDTAEAPAEATTGADGFMDIPDGIDESLPFA